MNIYDAVEYSVIFNFLVASIKFLLYSTNFFIIRIMNTTSAVFLLVLAFFLSALYVIMLGADFLALVLLVVYVGALAVLFLFVVMLLDIRLLTFYSSSQGSLVNGNVSLENKYLLFFSFFFSFFFLFFPSFNFDFSFFFCSDSSIFTSYLYFNWLSLYYSYSNVLTFGFLIYTFFFPAFFFSIFLLLIACVAVINLTFVAGFGETYSAEKLRTEKLYLE